MTNERKHSGKKDTEICAALGIDPATVHRVRKRYAEGGIPRALYDAPRPGKPRTFTAKDTAMVVAIACTDPPDGYGRWTIELIREEVIQRIGKPMGRNTIDKILLKNDCKPWLKKNVVYFKNYTGV
jgi:transposase